MATYYFHLRGDGLDFLDECGGDYADAEHARRQALWFAREALAEAVEEGRMPLRAFVDVENETGESQFVMPLRIMLREIRLPRLRRVSAPVHGR